MSDETVKTPNEYHMALEDLWYFQDDNQSCWVTERFAKALIRCGAVLGKKVVIEDKGDDQFYIKEIEI